MPNTASSWKSMMQIQRASAAAKGNTAKVAQINAALAAHNANLAAQANATLNQRAVNGLVQLGQQRRTRRRNTRRRNTRRRR